jgi:hypothetical protein
LLGRRFEFHQPVVCELAFQKMYHLVELVSG